MWVLTLLGLAWVLAGGGLQAEEFLYPRSDTPGSGVSGHQSNHIHQTQEQPNHQHTSFKQDRIRHHHMPADQLFYQPPEGHSSMRDDHHDQEKEGDFYLKHSLSQEQGGNRDHNRPQQAWNIKENMPYDEVPEVNFGSGGYFVKQPIDFQEQHIVNNHPVPPSFLPHFGGQPGGFPPVRGPSAKFAGFGQPGGHSVADLARPIRPSETQESGFVPEEILQFRFLYQSLRNQYGHHQLFNSENFDEEVNADRSGRFFDIKGMLNKMFYPSVVEKPDKGEVGAELDMSSFMPDNPFLSMPKPIVHHSKMDNSKLPGIEPCSNNEGVCMSSEKCIVTGGTPIGHCNRCMECEVCCKYLYEDQAVCESPIAYFQSPDYPDHRDSPHAASLTFTIRDDVDQVLIEFITFEMGIGSEGCTDQDFLEVIIPSKSDDLIGPGNSKFCGVNTDQHIYIDVSKGDLLILKVVATGDSSRHKSEHGHHKAYFGKSRPYRFKIKITQILAKEPFKKTYLKMGMLSVYHKEKVEIPKYYENLRAPVSCTQYYTGRKGTIENFNFDGRTQFPNKLDYSICIRTPKKACRLTLHAYKFSIPASDHECVDGTVPVSDGCTCCTKGGSHEAEVEKYLGFDGNSDGLAKDNQFRYFYCGERLGHTDFAVSERKGPIVLKVYSCDKSVKSDVKSVGFKIGYNVEAGTC